jgi:hypothetical protein
MTKAFFSFTFLFTFLIIFGQEKQKSFTVKFISENIIADGILDESIWEIAGNGADEFWEYFPLDSIQARKQSKIKILYDDKNYM